VLPKIGRAGARDTSSNGRGKSRRNTKPKVRSGGAKAANWLAAQLRAARHRAGHAVRLAAIGGVALAALIVSLYAITGRLDEAGTELVRNSERQLVQAGFTVDWLDIAGAYRVSPEAVAAAIGARPGAGLSEIDLDAARRALEAEPWVRSARLHRLWPNRLSVVIEERQPHALWQENGVHRVIDERGVVIEAADPADFAALPRVVGAGANTQAGEMIRLLRRHEDIASRVSHLIFVGERRWSLRLVSGGEVQLPQSDPAGAMVLLGRLHADRGVLDYDAQVLDLRNDGELVLRPWPDRAQEAAGRGA
jgi:cell division protein FtsQ